MSDENKTKKDIAYFETQGELPMDRQNGFLLRYMKDI